MILLLYQKSAEKSTLLANLNKKNPGQSPGLCLQSETTPLGVVFAISTTCLLKLIFFIAKIQKNSAH
jgi:hypothetical protein